MRKLEKNYIKKTGKICKYAKDYIELAFEIPLVMMYFSDALAQRIPETVKLDSALLNDEKFHDFIMDNDMLFQKKNGIIYESGDGKREYYFTKKQDGSIEIRAGPGSEFGTTDAIVVIKDKRPYIFENGIFGKEDILENNGADGESYNSGPGHRVVETLRNDMDPNGMNDLSNRFTGKQKKP